MLTSFAFHFILLPSFGGIDKGVDTGLPDGLVGMGCVFLAEPVALTWSGFPAWEV